MTSTNSTPIKRIGGEFPGRVTTGRVAVWAGVGYLALLLVLHLARRDVSMVWQTTSEYARGSGGWVMVVAFLLSAVALIALAVATADILRSVAGRIGICALVIAAIGTAVGGVFVTDPIETSQADLSRSGTIHGLAAGLALMLTPVAALLINSGLARRADSTTIKLWLYILAIVPLVALATFIGVQATVLPPDGSFGPDVAIGPAERVLVIAFALWQIITAAIVTRHKR